MTDKRITPIIAPTTIPVRALIPDFEPAVVGCGLEVGDAPDWLVVLAGPVDVGRFGKSIEAALGSTDAAPLMTLEQMEAISVV
jgi:hypothetical protein